MGRRMLHREAGLENKQAGKRREVMAVDVGGCTSPLLPWDCGPGTWNVLPAQALCLCISYGHSFRRLLPLGAGIVSTAASVPVVCALGCEHWEDGPMPASPGISGALWHAGDSQ